LYAFLAFDEREQAERVWSGTGLVTRTEGEHGILLYAIDSFYVEVFYHQEYNVIRHLRPFRETSHLEPYLDPIYLCNLL
jgi:hypothetical protein